MGGCAWGRGAWAGSLGVGRAAVHARTATNKKKEVNSGGGGGGGGGSGKQDVLSASRSHRAQGRAVTLPGTTRSVSRGSPRGAPPRIRPRDHKRPPRPPTRGDLGKRPAAESQNQRGPSSTNVRSYKSMVDLNCSMVDLNCSIYNQRTSMVDLLCSVWGSRFVSRGGPSMFND